jgi:glucan phosphoethanolaminetransferase (alkaline phosphatase superfamily)
MTDKLVNGKDLLQAIKSISEGSNRIITWSLSVVGGTILIIVSSSYLHPATKELKLAYLLFFLGWIFLAFSINKGIVISGRSMAAEFYSGNDKMIRVIFEKTNNDFKCQLNLFKWALLVFAIWLILFLFWWVFIGTSINK